MAKEYLIPYNTERLKSVTGFKAINISGASMMYFNDVDESALSELMYPCRINALVVLVCVKGNVSISSQMSDYNIGAGQFFISSASVFQPVNLYPLRVNQSVPSEPVLLQTEAVAFLL